MAVSGNLYASLLLRAFGKDIDLSNDVIKCMLCTSSYTPSQTGHSWKSDVTDEVTGTGYVAGGATIPNPDITLSALTTKFDGDDVEWASSTITARYAVVYDSSVTPIGALICYIDFGENKSSLNGLFKIQWHTNGIFQVTID